MTEVCDLISIYINRFEERKKEIEQADIINKQLGRRGEFILFALHNYSFEFNVSIGVDIVYGSHYSQACKVQILAAHGIINH